MAQKEIQEEDWTLTVNPTKFFSTTEAYLVMEVPTVKKNDTMRLTLELMFLLGEIEQLR